MKPRTLNQYEIDDMYSMLTKAHEGLDSTQSNLANACALFLLAAHVEEDTLKEILQIARHTATAAATRT
ncbi:hypothetical protein BN2475_260044 [Paraburkholderia ribeironis]|uniref:Uncharacterized protein n=1 Tax=Paraburkholderia ribeironis TaxID=1247936 RepID=A0A1N7RZN2_9BURK|nr:DUF2783 domain-containing protein [Paraburkholderia ribeironis]SIT40588.1 hypothetical protein BN2475_260044 [Paraburkholderia ribeironis]